MEYPNYLIKSTNNQFQKGYKVDVSPKFLPEDCGLYNFEGKLEYVKFNHKRNTLKSKGYHKNKAIAVNVLRGKLKRLEQL